MPTQAALAGQLEVLGLPSLVQALEMQGISGRLELPHGHIDFFRGGISGAGYGETSGIAAVNEHFLCGSGRFQFLPGTPEDQRSMGSVPLLVMEGCRLKDEWEELNTRVLQASGELSGALSSWRGELAPWQYAQRQGLARTTIVDAIIAATKRGALRATGQSRPEKELPPPEPLPEDFEDLMFEAHRRARQKNYAGARRALEAAVAQRPDSKIAQQNLKRILILENKAP